MATKLEKKKSLSFPGFSRVINLLFHSRLQKTNNIVILVIWESIVSSPAGSGWSHSCKHIFEHFLHFGSRIFFVCYNFSLKLHRLPLKNSPTFPRVFQVQTIPWIKFQVFLFYGYHAQTTKVKGCHCQASPQRWNLSLFITLIIPIPNLCAVWSTLRTLWTSELSPLHIYPTVPLSDVGYIIIIQNCYWLLYDPLHSVYQER